MPAHLRHSPLRDLSDRDLERARTKGYVDKRMYVAEKRRRELERRGVPSGAGVTLPL